MTDENPLISYVDLLAQLAQERLARRRETTCWADERDQMRRERDEARAALAVLREAIAFMVAAHDPTLGGIPCAGPLARAYDSTPTDLAAEYRARIQHKTLLEVVERVERAIGDEASEDARFLLAGIRDLADEAGKTK